MQRLPTFQSQSSASSDKMRNSISRTNSRGYTGKQETLRELQGKVNDVATLLTEEAYERQENQTQTADGRGTGGTISRDHSGESRSPDTETDTGKVQRLHSQNTQNSKMPVAVSGRNTVGNRAKQEELRGVRGEVSKSSSNDRVQAELKRIDRKISTLDRELKNLFEREKNRYNRVSMDVVIGELETAYRSLKNAEDDFIRQAYDEGVAERIETVKEEGIIQNKKAVDYHRFLFNTLPYCRLSIQD